MKRKIISTYLLIFVIGFSFVLPSFMNVMTTEAAVTIKVRLTWTEFNCTDSRDGNQDNGEFYLQVKYWKANRHWVRKKTSTEKIAAVLAIDINKKLTLRKCTLGKKMYIRVFDNDFLNSDDLVISEDYPNHGCIGNDNNWALYYSLPA